jgi:diacylglycerol O-acyltransferase-1
MSTLTDTATATSHSSMPASNGRSPEPVASGSAKMRDTKYRHVFATHSQSRMSSLTHGADTPSFVGFRNLMILLLGMVPGNEGLHLVNRSSIFKPAVDD